MKSPIDQYIIEAVRKERMAQNVSQATIAYWIGTSKGFVGQIESSKYPSKYSFAQLNEIAKYLNCSPRQFLPEKAL